MAMQAEPVPIDNGNRQRMLHALGLLFFVFALMFAIEWLFEGRFEEYTDDAYVNGNVVQLTPQVTGIVTAINADDTDLVQQGQTVVNLDNTDKQLAFDQAQANLANTIRTVRQLYQTAEQLKALVTQREAELTKAQIDLERREALVKAGAVSTENFQHNKNDAIAAAAALAQAQHQYQATNALVEHTTLLQYPTVLQAKADLRTAYLNLQRTNLAAPVTGYIAKRSVQLGQQVAVGMPLLAIVPLNQIWVDANFKESQLKNIRIGQTVELISDIYGSRVKYAGKVVGLSAGTGSAFSLLPPQNATGNWIKIVQRVPVRIQLDPEQVRKHPLRIGLSMEVVVLTHHRNYPMLAKVPSKKSVYTTSVFNNLDTGAEAIIEKIVRENT